MRLSIRPLRGPQCLSDCLLVDKVFLVSLTGFARFQLSLFLLRFLSHFWFRN